MKKPNKIETELFIDYSLAENTLNESNSENNINFIAKNYLIENIFSTIKQFKLAC